MGLPFFGCIQYIYPFTSVFLFSILISSYLSGQDVMSCGFMGAMMGGVLCGSKALNRNLWDDLVKLKKKISKNK